MAKIRKAKKEHRCTEKSYHRILPGDLYLYVALPPWHECSRGKKFEYIRACLRCAREYGMLSSETRKQLPYDIEYDVTNLPGLA